MFRQDGSCPALLEDLAPAFPYGAVTRCGPPFQAVPVARRKAAGLVRVRSPLLTESRLMSFPPATEMFQFAGFASRTYGFSPGYRLRGGLPHSETPGSPIARISPGLFAACCVLHRLSVPRHPPDALFLLLSPAHSGKPRPLFRPCCARPAAGSQPHCDRASMKTPLGASLCRPAPRSRHNSFFTLPSARRQGYPRRCMPCLLPSAKTAFGAAALRLSRGATALRRKWR